MGSEPKGQSITRALGKFKAFLDRPADGGDISILLSSIQSLSDSLSSPSSPPSSLPLAITPHVIRDCLDLVSEDPSPSRPMILCQTEPKPHFTPWAEPLLIIKADSLAEIYADSEIMAELRRSHERVHARFLAVSGRTGAQALEEARLILNRGFVEHEVFDFNPPHSALVDNPNLPMSPSIKNALRDLDLLWSDFNPYFPRSKALTIMNYLSTFGYRFDSSSPLLPSDQNRIRMMVV